MTGLNLILSRNPWIYIEPMNLNWKQPIYFKSSDFIDIHTSVWAFNGETCIITKDLLPRKVTPIFMYSFFTGVCGPGYGGASCTICGIGYYKPEIGDNDCTPCSSGTTTTVTGATRASQCRYDNTSNMHFYSCHNIFLSFYVQWSKGVKWKDYDVLLLSH